MPLLRIALVLALLMTLAFGAIKLIDPTGVMVATAVKLDASPASTPVANRALLPDLESGACISLAATHAGSGQTVFIDPGHGGLDPGVVGGSAAHQVLEKDATLAVSSNTALPRAPMPSIAFAMASEPYFCVTAALPAFPLAFASSALETL